MATTAEYLAQLQTDKQTLVDNLVAKGVEATNDETFTTLAPKVADISGGGDADFEITDASYLFYDEARLDKMNELLGVISPSCTNFAYMFYDCQNIKSVPKINTSNATSLVRMFYNCRSLKEIPELDTTNVTSLFGTFSGCRVLTEVPITNTSNVTTFESAFSDCRALVSIPELDTSNAWSLNSMFSSCYTLETIPELDATNVTVITGMLSACTMLKNFGGLKDYGKAFPTTLSANEYGKRLTLSQCSLLTHESLMNVINNLYDIASIGVEPQSLVLGATNIAKLTEEEIAVATAKGWVVS